MLKIRKKLAEKKEASKGIAKAGFTLIELLVVIAILAILVLLAAPRFLGYTKDANVAAMQADAKVLANSALIYNIENEDKWPVVEGEVTVDVNGTDVEAQNLDESVLRKDHVQTLKGEFENYALVVADAEITIGTDEDGEPVVEKLQKGDIVHKTGVVDRDGDKHYAVNVEVDKDIVVAETGE